MINTRFGHIIKIFLFVGIVVCFPLCSLFAKHGKWTIRVMEYNVENLFDCEHDSLKNDEEYLPDGACSWTYGKYWRKLNAVARGIVLASTSEGTFIPPDIVGLCEVENDSVLHSLVHRSLLRGAGYEYVMTDSPDLRGVDVALLYQPVTFRLTNHYGLRVDTVPGMRPTRDILYVKGEVLSHRRAEMPSEAEKMAFEQYPDETGTLPLHVFVVHSPSRRGGERTTRPFRRAVMSRLMQSVDSIRLIEREPRIIVMGDFNDYDGDPSLRYLSGNGFTDVTAAPYITSDKQVRGTYRYQGEWGSLDHIVVTQPVLETFNSSFVGKHPDLLENDDKYGGVKPFRFFRGPTMHGGYSDHLPLIADFDF